MKSKIDIATWARRSHFEYFSGYDCPMFSMAFPIEADRLYHYARSHGISFFAICLHAMMKATNSVPQLCQRVENNEVWQYDKTDALTPILAANGEFTHVVLPYHAQLETFLDTALPIIETAKAAPAQANASNAQRQDLAVYSCIPWIPFTQVASAYSNFHQQFYPLIHWGKIQKDTSSRLSMPVSIQANHVLVDGVHIGKFYEALNQYCALL